MIKARVVSFGRLLGETTVKNKKELDKWIETNNFNVFIASGIAGLETKNYYYKKKKKGI